MPPCLRQSAVWLRSTEDEELLLRSLNRADRLDFENWQENDLEKCIPVYYKSFEEVRKIYLEMKRLPCKHCSRCRKTASSPRSFSVVLFRQSTLGLFGFPLQTCCAGGKKCRRVSSSEKISRKKRNFGISLSIQTKT